MRVAEVSEFGGPEVLRPAERSWPVAGPGEVVVEIAAANVNPTDVGARAGATRRRLPDLAPPFVLGWDLAGVVGDAGPGESRFEVGDPVVGMIPWYELGGAKGSYAEAAAVDPAWLAPRPAELDPVQAATIPLNSLTASQMIALLALPAGGRLLVVGASGAVGSFAVQLAARAGLKVVAQASTDDEEWVASLGAATVIDRDADLAALDPCDGVFDAVPIGLDAAAAVADGGAIVFTRRVDGVEALAARGVTAHTPLVHSDPATLAELTAMVARGELRTRVARTLDLADAAEAHRLVERGGLRGKVVLRTGS
jgi:NADPH:quinone reductase-like Zn-dependent oxidoreductase